MNKKCLTSILILFLLLASSIVAVSGATDEPLKIVLDAAHETSHAGDLDNLPDKLEAWGYTVEVVTDEITSDVLSDADILLIPMPEGIPYSSGELNAVKAWFDAGNVAIWVAGDSDYNGPDIIPACNAILTKINSKIRIENASLEEPDAEFNDGAAYRVVVSDWNSGHPISEGVSKETFHGPTFLYGLDDGAAVNLSTTTLKNVDWVAKTSENSVIVVHHLTEIETPGYADGDTGAFVTMATEKKAGADKSSKIVVTTEAIFCSYKNMNADGPSEKGNHEIQGGTLLQNTIQWMGEVEKDSNTMLYAGIGIAIVILLAAGAIFLRKK